MRMESLPYGLAAMVNFAKKLAPGSMERVNVSIQNQIKMGGKIIEEYPTTLQSRIFGHSKMKVLNTIKGHLMFWVNGWVYFYPFIIFFCVY